MTAMRKCPRDLSIGDVVRTDHGVLCLIDQAPQVVVSHPLPDVYATRALVLNAGDLVGSIMPLPWLCDHEVPDTRDGWPDVYVGRWTIQGNDFCDLDVIATGQSLASVGLAATVTS